MEKLYYTDPYLRNTQCTILSVDGNKVTTDRTIFYPEGGGQDGDCGFIGSVKVIDTRKADDGNSILITEDASGLKAGDRTTLVLDWEHRHRCMVTHTAQHLLSGLLYTMYGIGTVAVHMAQDYLTIETDRESVDVSKIDGLVERANREILAARKVTYAQMSHEEATALGLRRSIKVEGDVRIVTIEDVDRIACGGVHVSDTLQIRLIVFTGHEQIRGHERLYFRCGQAAVENAVSDSRIVKSLCSSLSCRDEEIEEKVRGLVSELNARKAKLSELSQQLETYNLKNRLDSEGIACYQASEEEDLSLTGRCACGFDNIALCVLQDKGPKTVWLIVLSGCYNADFNIFRTKLLAPFNAKGGGKAPLFQGVMENCDADAFFREFRKILGEIRR